MNYRYQLKPRELKRRIAPEEMGLKYTSAERLEPGLAGGPVVVETEGEEVVLVTIEGACDFKHAQIEGRAECMDFVYVPRNSRIELSAGEPAVVMRFGARADRDTSAVLIRHGEVAADPRRHASYGSAETNCRRDVYHYITDDFDASRLLMGICQGDTGGWTSWPPHEHAAQKEELYVYFDMGNAFAVQCVYEDMDDPLFVGMVRDGDLVSVPRGYHPNVGVPAGRISFVYVMSALKAGDRSFMDLTIQKEFGDRFQ